MHTETYDTEVFFESMVHDHSSFKKILKLLCRLANILLIVLLLHVQTVLSLNTLKDSIKKMRTSTCPLSSQGPSYCDIEQTIVNKDGIK